MRGPRQNSRHRTATVSRVTASKERPSSSAFWVSIIGASSGLGSRVISMPEAGLMSFYSRCGGPFPNTEAGVLVGSEEASELQVVIAGETLEPACEVTTQHRHAADQHGVRRCTI